MHWSKRIITRDWKDCTKVSCLDCLASRTVPCNSWCTKRWRTPITLISISLSTPPWYKQILYSVLDWFQRAFPVAEHSRLPWFCCTFQTHQRDGYVPLSTDENKNARSLWRVQRDLGRGVPDLEVRNIHSITFLSSYFKYVAMIRYEGIRGFYKGLVPSLLRVTPATAITFVVYEKVSRAFTHLLEETTMPSSVDHHDDQVSSSLIADVPLHRIHGPSA